MDGDQVKQSGSDNQQHRPAPSHSDPLVSPTPESEGDESSVKADAVSELENIVDEEQTVPEDQVVPERQPQTTGTAGDAFQTPSVPQEEPPKTGGTAGDTFQTPSVPQEEPPKTGGTAGDTFQTPSVPQEQPQTGGTAGDTFQTPSVPQEQLQTGGTAGDTFQTPSVPQEQLQTGGMAEDSFETPSVQQVQPPENVYMVRDTFETPSAPLEQSQTERTAGSFQTPSAPPEQPKTGATTGNGIRGSGGNGFATPGASLIVDPDVSFDVDQPSSSWLNHPMDYFAFWAFVTVAVVTVVFLIVGRYRRWVICGRRRKPRGKRWANEINFHDEYESTDEDTDDPEDFNNSYMAESHPNGPIDSFGGSKSVDWLGDMNFAVGEEDNQDAKKADNPTDFVKDEDEESESEVSYDSDGNSLSDLLNGESSQSNRGDSLLAPQSPPVSPSVDFAPDPKILPPTVSEVFKNSMTPHWENGKKPAPQFEQHNTLEELHRQQGDLNQALFSTNDQLLEQQRELKAASKKLGLKTTRRKHRDIMQKHQSIVEEISRLEDEKDDIDAQIKTAKSKIKAHRHDRRLKLFANHE